jgi:hypothetical protein
MLDARIAAYDHDPAGPAPNHIHQPIDEREMSDVVDEELKLNAITGLQSWEIRDPRIRDEGIQRTGQAS